MTSDESQTADGLQPNDTPRVVMRISPMAHLASGFAALGMLTVVLAVPWTAPLLVIPLIASAMIVRLRTLLGSRTVDWADITGLRFTKGSWARAELASGEDLRLPAVTFATLPRFT